MKCVNCSALTADHPSLLCARCQIERATVIIALAVASIFVVAVLILSLRNAL